MGVGLDSVTPPFDAVMPAEWQTVLVWVGLALSLASSCWAVLLATRGRSWIPIASWIGGVCAVLLEPFSDVLALAWHPIRGQLSAFTAFGRPVPWHIVLFYGPYYFGPAACAISWMRSRQLTKGRYWAVAIGMMLTALIWEIFPIRAGVWMYYGAQPLRVFGMPVWFVAVNASCLMTAALAAAWLDRYLKTAQGFLMALIAPPAIQAAMTAGVGWPVETALNSQCSALGLWAASLLTLLLAFLVARLTLSMVLTFKT